MAKKSSSTKKREAEQARLKAGGISINKNAKKEIARRNQTQMNQTLGTDKYSVKDKMAQNAVKEIDRRKNLSSFLAAKKEQQLAEERTQRNKNLSQYATYNLGNPNEAYAIRMAGYNNKGESKYLNEIIQRNANKATNEWKKRSQDAANAGVPELAYAEKMILDTPVSQEKAKKAGGEGEARRQDLKKFLANLGRNRNMEPVKEYYSPKDQYAMLPEDQKDRWMNPSKSEELKNIVSLSGAQERLNKNRFEKDLDTLNKEKEEWQGKLDQYNAQTEELRKDIDVRSQLLEHGLDIKPNDELDINEKMTVHKRPDDYFNSAGLYGDRAKYYDTNLYDYIYGEGAYDKVLNEGTDEEFTAVDEEISKLWDMLENGKLTAEYDTIQSNKRYAQKELERIDKEIANQQGYYTFMDSYKDPVEVGYRPENDRGGQAYGSMAEIDRGVQTNDVHRIYSFINKGMEYEKWAEGIDVPQVTSEYSKAGLMVEDEIKVFNDFYNKGQYNEASAFLKGLEPYLNARYSDYASIYRQRAASIAPITSSVLTPFMNLANAYIDPARHIAHAFGDKSTEDPNSAWYALANESEEITNTIANNIGGIGGKIYSNFMNSASNLVRGLTTPGSTKLAKSILGLGSFFLQVDQEATARYLKDHSYDDAAKLGALDAAFEVVEEFLPYETMLGSEGRGLGLSLLLNGLSEMGQEFTGATVFEKLKGIITGEDSEQARTDEIIAKGYYLDGNGKRVTLSDNKETALAQARTQAAKEFWQNAVENGLGGLFGGTVGGFYGTAAQALQISNVGKTIKNKNGAIESLIQTGLEADESSLSYKMAIKLQGKMKKGNDVSVQDAGKLAQTLETEASETLQQAVKGEHVAESDVERSLRTIKSVSEVMTPEGEKQEGGLQLASQNDIRNAEGEVTKHTREVIVDGRVAKIDGVKTVRDENGKWQLKLTVGGQDYNAYDVLNTNYHGAQIIRQAALNPQMYSGRLTDALLDAAENGQIQRDVDMVLRDAKIARILAYGGRTAEEIQGYTRNMDRKLLENIVRISAEEHGENRKEQVKGANRKATGGVTFNGETYQSEKWNKWYNSLDKNTKAQVDVAAGIMQRAGIEADFRDMEDAELYGQENRKGIAINVGGLDFEMDGGQKTAKGRHHMLVTLGHEMTHWLQRNSLQGYNRLERFVLGEYLDKNGVDSLLKRINSHMNAADGLNLEDSISEIVADSCDQILSNESVMQHIQETDSKLYTEVKGFVKNLVERFKTAMANMGLSASREAKSIGDGINRIAKVWLGAYDEAISGMISEEEAAEDTTRNSVAGIDKLSLRTLYISNFAPNTPNSIKSQRIIDMIQDVWSKKPITLKVYDDNSNGRYIEAHFDPDFDPTNTRKTDAGKMAFGNRQGSRTERRVTMNLADDYRHILQNANYYTFELERKKHPGVKKWYYFTNDIYYAEQGSDTAIPYRIEIDVKENADGDFVYTYFAREDKNAERKKLSVMDLVPVNTGVMSGESASASIENISQNNEKDNSRSSRWSQDVDTSDWKTYSMRGGEMYMRDGNGNETKLTGLDREYVEAWKRNDFDRMEEILMDKIRENGAIPFKAPNGYTNPDHIWVSNNIKEGNMIAIRQAAAEMATMVPKNAVLVPMPDRTGKVTENTDTRILADEIAKITGSPVVNALAGVERESVRENRMNKSKSQRMTAEDLGFRQAEEIPEGMIPYFVDNVVTSGTTAKAAHMAMGNNGVTLAYSKARGGIDGLKRANVTFYDTTKQYGEYLIPLSERIDMDQTGLRGTRFSKAQLDAEYDAAVKSGDTDLQRELVDQAAQKAGYTDIAYHGTKSFGFTKFNLKAGSGLIFVSYDQDLASTYTENGDVREIGTNVNNNMKFKTDFTDQELMDHVMGPLADETRASGTDIINVRKTGENEFTATVEYVGFNGETKQDEIQFTKNDIVSDYQKRQIESGETEQGIYHLYTRPGNQLVIDANGAIYGNIAVPWTDKKLTTGEIAEYARQNGYDSVRINNLRDGGDNNSAEKGIGDVGIFFNQGDVKSADPVTYDNNGKVIPLSEHFNDDENDIRWSKAEAEAEEYGVQLDAENHTATLYSRASYERSEYYKNPDEMAKMLARNVLGSESRRNVAKAKKWIKDVTSISAMIAENSDLLDYIASPGRSSFKSNPEYGGSIDSSTICAKRRLQTGTIDAIQRAMPDYVMTAEDFLHIRNMMKERNYEVSCGLCFVESSRKNIAKYASQFMKEWNREHPDNKVNMTQINTVLGLEETRTQRKEVYEAYEKFMNKLAQRKPKLFEMRSEYDNDIIKHFRNDTTVADKNRNGGMRINSFSDFEIVHLIDMMQVIMDMANVGLAGQAYTKVREFAEALGPTGLKINMSMIAKGVDADGRIIFDEVEGMKWSDVEDLRNKYADNVGTICVVFTEEQLMAAMNDDRIDFIIPFHRSQWNKSNYKDIGLPEDAKDFTYWQNERYAKPVYSQKKDSSPKKLRASNYMPNEYWDFSKSGKENAEIYLQKCFENNKIPKFWKWLQSNGDGSFSLKEDGSTDGYWKLLIDFKMYNHITNKGAEQMPVHPDFDMEASRRMLENYKGGHAEFPEAEDVVRDFVNEKKNGRKGIARGTNGKITLAAPEIDNVRESRWTEESMDVNAWINGLTPGSLQTEDERTLLQAYKDLRMKIQLSLKKQLDYKAKIKQLEGKENLTAEEKETLTIARNRLVNESEKMARLEDEMFQVTSSEGYAGMMYRENMKLKDYIEGKTQDQVKQTVEEMLNQVKAAQKQIEEDREEIRKLANSQAIQAVKANMGKTSLGRMATMLRKQYNSSLSKSEIEDRLAEMALKKASSQDISSDVEALAQDLVDKIRGIRSDALESLRGKTLIISKETLKQLKAQNSSLNEIRSKLKGSGVTIKTEDYSRLDEQWREMRESNYGLPDIDGIAADVDKLTAVADFIENEMKASRGAEQYGLNMDEVRIMVKAAVNNINTYLTDDPAAKKQIESLMKQIADLGQKTGDIGNRLEALGKQLDEVVLAGIKAKGWSSILQRDVNDAIRYYNKTAAVAARVEKNAVRKLLIEQLRGENAKKLIAQREKYEQKMRDDKHAREMAQDNLQLRSKITTNIRRIRERLTAETDEKNIPEEAKPLARFMSSLLVKYDTTEGNRHVLAPDKKGWEDFRMRLDKMDEANGAFDPDSDLDFLVIKAPNPEDNDTSIRDKVIQDLMDIESGLLEYRMAEGLGTVSIADRKAALKKIQEAVSEITSVIKARGEAFIKGKRYELELLAEQMENEMKASRFKGEYKGFGSGARNAVTKAIGYGNLTPEYFFKNLKNGVMSLLHSGFHDAEQRSGLEAAKAKNRIAQIAAETGFNTWDGQQKVKIMTRNGATEITTEQLMSLYATWQREKNQLRPEETAHLLGGGFVLGENEKGGKPRREKNKTHPIRITEDQLNALGKHLTPKQRAYVDAIVDYMSNDLAQLGNEASMETYGIKKFTEKYYFPIKSWGGVLNKSSDSGIANKNDNRAMRQSFTKRIKANAANALEIGDFTPTAMKHIVGMITFNTVGPAVENMNKVLNQQLKYGMSDEAYKMNVRSVFRNAYGQNALEYLEQFMSDVNGGMTQKREASLRESLLSIFKKNAVAGSMSVAAQQPLSYIRAAMMINPKYMAQALNPKYWKGSYKEMLEHSGIAVIKAMGKFDMNFGRSMIDYITPEGMIPKAKAAWQNISEKSTMLPEKMDAMTWTRMWTACKLEVAAQNKEMDTGSEAFLEKVAERFNEVMRRTQVYDSVMVKSQNMRSTNYLKKVTTSFMAEPTLSLNVLTDAWQNRKDPEGVKNAITALVTFLLSAAAQAGAKAFFGAGRSPDKKKTQEENFWNKYAYNVLSEANPISLIPGYSQMMDVLMNGKLNDDAMGVIGKAKEAYDNIWKLATGQQEGKYRSLEDSVGQLVQFATDIPLKNFMRDFRAMVNWFSGGKSGFTGDTYADRPTSSAVMKYQLIDTLVSDDIAGLINERLGEAGYGTSNKDYYKRIYEADKAGNKQAADEMKEYIILKSTASDPEKSMNSALKSLAAEDEDLSVERKMEMQKEYGLKDAGGYVLDEYREGNLKRAEAEKLYRQERPNATDKDVLEAFDRIDWEKKTGEKNYTNYTPLYAAIGNNKSDEIKAAVKHMTENGYKKEDIKRQLTTKYKQAYLESSGSERTKLRDALTKAYKAIGLTAEQALKIIDGWKKK